MDPETAKVLQHNMAEHIEEKEVKEGTGKSIRFVFEKCTEIMWFEKWIKSSCEKETNETRWSTMIVQGRNDNNLNN